MPLTQDHSLDLLASSSVHQNIGRLLYIKWFGNEQIRDVNWREERGGEGVLGGGRKEGR